METVLQAKNVRKIYGSKGNVYTALENISIDIKEGEFTGIMGPSGWQIHVTKCLIYY